LPKSKKREKTFNSMGDECSSWEREREREREGGWSGGFGLLSIASVLHRCSQATLTHILYANAIDTSTEQSRSLPQPKPNNWYPNLSLSSSRILSWFYYYLLVFHGKGCIFVWFQWKFKQPKMEWRLGFSRFCGRSFIFAEAPKQLVTPLKLALANFVGLLAITPVKPTCG
jgi:hypothetical protein